MIMVKDDISFLFMYMSKCWWRFISPQLFLFFFFIREIYKSGTHSRIWNSLQVIHKETQPKDNLENTHEYQKDKPHRFQGQINVQM
jgi:hypothetical protein